jgi:spoIIIJ-associated protein
MEQPMDQGNVEFEGKNLDVAIWKASQQLGIPIEKLRYAILSQGKRGPGGVSLEPARIRILSGDEALPAPAAPATPAPRSEPASPQQNPAARAEHPVPIAEADEDELEAAAPDELDGEEIEAAALPDDEDDDLDEEREEEAVDEDDDSTEEREEEAAVDEDDDERLDDDDDLEDLPLPMPTSIEEDDPIEEARRARQDRGSAPERRAAPLSPEAPERPQPAERQRPPRRERAIPPAPHVERSQPPPRRAEAEEETRDSGSPSGGPASGAPAVEDLEGGMARAREVLPELLAEMGFDLASEFALEEDHVYVALTGDDAAYLVDDRAEGLNSLQYLLNKMVYRGGPTRIVVDANGYRKERQQEIVARALELAQEVRDTGESRSLGTLNPFERRLVHMALRDDANVRTVSHGDAFLKRLEITPKRGDDVDRSPRFPAGWDRDGSTGRHGRPRGGRGRGGR